MKILLLSIFFITVTKAIWTADNYPNPVIQYLKCGMNYSSYICDPDNVLESFENRQLINQKLKWLKSVTASGIRGCARKGITPVLVMGKQFEDGSSRVC